MGSFASYVTQILKNFDLCSLLNVMALLCIGLVASKALVYGKIEISINCDNKIHKEPSEF